jgi:hypothetical protein
MEQVTNPHDTTNKTILDSTQAYETNDYHYGERKTKATFSIKLESGEGFKTAIQPINPETGQPDAVQIAKDSSPFIYMYRDKEDGHIKFGYMGLFHESDVNTMADFIAQHFDALKLTKDMINEVYSLLFAFIAGIEIYSDLSIQEAINKIIQPTLDVIVEGMNQGTHIFNQIKLDVEAINKVKNDHLEEQIQNRKTKMKRKTS